MTRSVKLLAFVENSEMPRLLSHITILIKSVRHRQVLSGSLIQIVWIRRNLGLLLVYDIIRVLSLLFHIVWVLSCLFDVIRILGLLLEILWGRQLLEVLGADLNSSHISQLGVIRLNRSVL